jgi:hypothetical protein
VFLYEVKEQQTHIEEKIDYTFLIGQGVLKFHMCMAKPAVLRKKKKKQKTHTQ